MEMICKLKELYPSGLVLGNAGAIVGDLGLIIIWIETCGDKIEKRFNAGDIIPITRILDASIELADGTFPLPIVSCRHFKGFIYKKRNKIKNL